MSALHYVLHWQEDGAWKERAVDGDEEEAARQLLALRDVDPNAYAVANI